MQHEITIDGYVASGPHDLVQVAGALSEGRMSPECLSSFVFADQVVAQIEAARDARVLFVRVGGPGGSVEGSFRIYEALRRFAASGGWVVTYALPGRVASTATTLLLAGDVRFMHPDADLLIHSVIAAGGTELGDKGVRDEMNRRMLEVYATRTTTPRAALEEALACTFDADGVLQARRIPVDAARAFRWVTFALAEETARAMAEQLAAPGGLADVPAGAVGAREIRALSIEASHIKAGEITADKIAAGQLKTSNYAEDASGNPTAGAKLDHQGTAMKVAAGNLQVGTRTLADRTSPVVSITISGTNTQGQYVFGTAQPDAAYSVVLTPATIAGTPPDAAFIVRRVAKQTISFAVHLAAAPGAGNSITWEAMLSRPF